MVNIAYSMVNPFFPSNKKPPMTTKNIDKYRSSFCGELAVSNRLSYLHRVAVLEWKNREFRGRS